MGFLSTKGGKLKIPCGIGIEVKRTEVSSLTNPQAQVPVQVLGLCSKCSQSGFILAGASAYVSVTSKNPYLICQITPFWVPDKPASLTTAKSDALNKPGFQKYQHL